MPGTPRSRSAAPGPAGLSARDFRRYLMEHAATVAPSDVTTLLGRATEIRHRLAGERAVHPRLAARARVALALLGDHAGGDCPQIPYQTVALLTTALYYYLAPMDVIPDFIPGAGTADDAIVLDVAWQLAGPGVQRYLDATGATLDDTSGQPREPRPPRSRRR